jgi:PEP-CTERM motif
VLHAGVVRGKLRDQNAFAEKVQEVACFGSGGDWQTLMFSVGFGDTEVGNDLARLSLRGGALRFEGLRSPFDARYARQTIAILGGIMGNDLNGRMTRRIQGHFRGLGSSALRWALLAMLLLAGVSTARADGFDTFVLTDGTQTMTWTLPSSPTPDPALIFPGDHFSIDGPIPITEFNGSTTTVVNANLMTFFNGNAVSDGGLASKLVNPADLIDAFLGEQQLYTGPESTPTFIPGTYTETGPEDDANNFPGCTATEQDNACGVGNTWALSTSTDVNLTLTITPAPEPSSMILLATGLLGLMGMGLRRKRLI